MNKFYSAVDISIHSVKQKVEIPTESFYLGIHVGNRNVSKNDT